MDVYLMAGVHQQPDQSNYLAEGQTCSGTSAGLSTKHWIWQHCLSMQPDPCLQQLSLRGLVRDTALCERPYTGGAPEMESRLSTLATCGFGVRTSLEAINRLSCPRSADIALKPYLIQTFCLP